ncbi:hypothetical protein [Acetobacterium wieringae]|uniref:O-antigen ligase family protein n=1 Tax=Acetobacterium wieringae TaxID=52694 RepID=A0A1F2PND4_9FIRM|nr:hypothetical protein [Acetobacterium wieringae]OFV72445.1 hypothetical protein ACWI_00480 [Acetobacterium wieringae]
MMIRKSVDPFWVLALALILIIIGLSYKPFLIIGIIIASCYVFFRGAEGIYGLFLMLPFSPILKLSPGGMTFFNLLIAVYILRMIFFNEKSKVSIYQVLSVLALIIFSLFKIDNSSLIKLVDLLIYFVLAILVMNSKETIDIRKLLLFFIVGIITASVLGLFSDYVPGLDGFIRETQIELDDGDIFGRFSGIQTNPNFYTMDITIAIATLLYMIGMKKHHWYDYLMVAVLLGFGILSLSISFFLTIGGIFLLYFIYKLFQLSRISFDIKVFIRGMVVILFVLIIVSQLANIPYFDIYLRRIGVGSFVDQSLSDLTTGRSDIWSEYLNLYLSDWKIFLFGLGYSLEKYNLRQSHSYYLELLLHLGIIGSVVYFNVLIAVFKPFSIKIRGRLLCLLPLAALVMRGFAINLLFRENFIFYLIICALVMADDKDAGLNTYLSDGVDDE